MMKILILDDDDLFRPFLITLIESVFNESDITECVSPKEALLLFESDPYFQVILSSLDLKNGSFMEVFQHFKSRNYKTPIIAYTSDKTNDIYSELEKGLPILKRPDSLSSNKFLEELFQFEPFNQCIIHFNGDYKRVRLFYFFRFYQLSFPIFIKLNEHKFIKILNPNQTFGVKFLEKYRKKGKEFLYVKEEDFSKLTDTLYKSPLFQVSPSEDPINKQRRKATLIIEMARTVGLTPLIIEDAKENLTLVINEVKKDKSLSKLFKTLEDSGTYNSDHSLLLCYLTSAMCDDIGWTTRRSKEKLAFASLFHDVTLKDPMLTVINYRSLIGLKRFDFKNQEDYKNHPTDCAKIVKDITKTYPQVDTIIEQHHERPDGTGFPYGKNYSQLLPLSCLFIVAHDFISRAYESRFEMENIKETLDSMNQEYSIGHFKKCMKGLRNVLNAADLNKQD